MNLFSKLFSSRDKPKDYLSIHWPFLFGGIAAGRNVNESGAYTANYDEATGTLDNPYGGDRTYFYGDGSGMYFKFSSEVPAAVKQ